MKLHAAGLTDVGRQRKGNEDAFHIDDELRLFVVSDGMGGAASGEVASALAVQTVIDEVTAGKDLLENVERGDAKVSEMVALARRAVEKAADVVYQTAQSPKGSRGMGCTLTIGIVASGVLAMAHVGDSRLYLLRDGAVTQLSRDHTMVAELLKAGVLTQEQAESHPYAHVITRAIGTQPAVEVDTLRIELLPADRLLFCSDGYSNYVAEPEELLEPMAGDDLEALCKAMVQQANDAGGRDNITVLLVDVAGEDAVRSVAITERYEALGGVFLFEGLTLPLLARVMEWCTEERHGEGDVVIAEGDAIRDLFIVVEGSYELRHGDEVVATLGRGDEAGLSTVMRQRPAAATLVATASSRLLRLQGQDLAALVRQRPWLGLGLLERLGRRLSHKLEITFSEREGGEPETTHGERL